MKSLEDEIREDIGVAINDLFSAFYLISLGQFESAIFAFKGADRALNCAARWLGSDDNDWPLIYPEEWK